MKKVKRFFAVQNVILLLLAVVVGVYLHIYYHADEKANAIASTGRLTESKFSDVVFGPEDATVGVIIYPGAKVEAGAYAPLIKMISEQNILCAVVHMPANMAMFNKDAAEDIMSLYPNVEHWYIGGHSLGGVVASDYVCKHPEKFDGIILLASYTTKDMSDLPVRVISIYGANDQVLNRERYMENYVNLPDDTIEIVIEGGNHSQFGVYGFQKGDGEATITGEEQLNQTVEAIALFVSSQE